MNSADATNVMNTVFPLNNVLTSVLQGILGQGGQGGFLNNLLGTARGTVQDVTQSIPATIHEVNHGATGMVHAVVPGGVPGVINAVTPGGVPGVVQSVIPGGVPTVFQTMPMPQSLRAMPGTYGGLIYDQQTGLYFDQTTGYYVDPVTGQYIDPYTGYDMTSGPQYGF